MLHARLKTRFHLTCLGAAIGMGLLSVSALADAPGPAIAPLKEGVTSLFVAHQGRSVKVQRMMDDAFRASSGTRSNLMINTTSCPPFCLTPIRLDVPVATIGEVEIVDFMSNEMRSNKGVLVDVRGKRQYDIATIPGSVHYSVTVFKKGEGEPEFDAMLEAFGAKRRGEVGTVARAMEAAGLGSDMVTDKWDFSEAKHLILWSQGAVCGLSPTSIEALVAAGYPTEKLSWYRGGLPAWEYWGFNTVRAPKKY